MTRIYILLLFHCFLAIGAASAQTLSSTYMQGKGTGFVNLNMNHNTSKKIFVGKSLLDDIPVFEKTEQTAISVYGIYGINDRFDLGASLTTVTARGIGNFDFAETIGIDSYQTGLQDLTLTGFYTLSETTVGEGFFRINGIAQLILPIGNYTIGKGLQSIIAIGNDTFSVEAGLGGLFKFSSNFYFSLENSFIASSSTMPSAIKNHSFVGYINKDVIMEIFMKNFWSLSGSDIFGLGFDGNFPHANIQRNRLGLYLCKPIGSGVVMTTTFETLIAGRNTHKTTGISLGLGYTFGQNRMKLNHY